ncbi:hypothetical protein ACFL2D_02615 [Patescibacteria group bacterium]
MKNKILAFFKKIASLFKRKNKKMADKNKDNAQQGPAPVSQSVFGPQDLYQPPIKSGLGLEASEAYVRLERDIRDALGGKTPDVDVNNLYTRMRVTNAVELVAFIDAYIKQQEAAGTKINTSVAIRKIYNMDKNRVEEFHTANPGLRKEEEGRPATVEEVEQLFDPLPEESNEPGIRGRDAQINMRRRQYYSENLDKIRVLDDDKVKFVGVVPPIAL